MPTAAMSANPSRPLESVLTASIAPETIVTHLERPQVVEQLSAPGPARLARVLLSDGTEAAVVLHDSENFVEILASAEPGIEEPLAELIHRLHIPPESIDWVRAGLSRAVLFPPISSLQEAKLNSEIKTLSAQLQGQPATSDVATPSERELRLQQLQQELLAARVRRIVEIYALDTKHAPPMPEAELPRQSSIVSVWIRSVELEHRRSARRYDYLAVALNAVVVVLAAMAAGAATSALAITPIVAIVTAMVGAFHLLLRPAKRSRTEEELASRFELARIELETVANVREHRPPHAVLAERYEHALRLLDAAAPDAKPSQLTN